MAGTGSVLLATMVAAPMVCADDSPARSAEPWDTGWAFALDNDVLFPGATQDRDYTGGMSLTLAGRRAQAVPLSLERARYGINQWLGLPSEHLSRHSIEYGLIVFTPQELHDRNKQAGDRPYASLLYVANTGADIDEQEETAKLSTLSVGVLGAGFVDDFQWAMHRSVGLQEPVGWENQISDGGELTGRYSVARTTRHWHGKVSGSQAEMTGSWRASVGYLSQLTVGISTRVGSLDSPWWSYNPQITDYAEKSVPFIDGSAEHYGWAGAALHARAYNVFLQGQFRDSQQAFAADELRPLVAEAWLGYTHAFANGWRFSYTLRAQSSEIREGPGDRKVMWGGVVISRRR